MDLPPVTEDDAVEADLHRVLPDAEMRAALIAVCPHCGYAGWTVKFVRSTINPEILPDAKQIEHAKKFALAVKEARKRDLNPLDIAWIAINGLYCTREADEPHELWLELAAYEQNRGMTEDYLIPDSNGQDHLIMAELWRQLKSFDRALSEYEMASKDDFIPAELIKHQMMIAKQGDWSPTLLPPYLVRLVFPEAPAIIKAKKVGKNGRAVPTAKIVLEPRAAEAENGPPDRRPALSSAIKEGAVPLLPGAIDKPKSDRAASAPAAAVVAATPEPVVAPSATPAPSPAAASVAASATEPVALPVHTQAPAPVAAAATPVVQPDPAPAAPVAPPAPAEPLTLVPPAGNPEPAPAVPDVMPTAPAAPIGQPSAPPVAPAAAVAQQSARSVYVVQAAPVHQSLPAGQPASAQAPPLVQPASVPKPPPDDGAPRQDEPSPLQRPAAVQQPARSNVKSISKEEWDRINEQENPDEFPAIELMDVSWGLVAARGEATQKKKAAGAKAQSTDDDTGQQPQDQNAQASGPIKNDYTDAINRVESFLNLTRQPSYQNWLKGYRTN
jgi:hypothetical protein